MESFLMVNAPNPSKIVEKKTNLSGGKCYKCSCIFYMQVHFFGIDPYVYTQVCVQLSGYISSLITLLLCKVITGTFMAYSIYKEISRFNQPRDSHQNYEFRIFIENHHFCMSISILVVNFVFSNPSAPCCVA